jgi:CheY-like chemotaxis protein
MAKGHRILIARNGKEAIELTQLNRPDLILMDIQMPEVNGFQAIQTIRSDPQFQFIPIIALTALAMVDDRQRCLAAGADEYIAKPIPLNVLSLTIQTLLANTVANTVASTLESTLEKPCGDRHLENSPEMISEEMP